MKEENFFNDFQFICRKFNWDYLFQKKMNQFNVLIVRDILTVYDSKLGQAVTAAKNFVCEEMFENLATFEMRESFQEVCN